MAKTGESAPSGDCGTVCRTNSKSVIPTVRRTNSKSLNILKKIFCGLSNVDVISDISLFRVYNSARRPLLRTGLRPVQLFLVCYISELLTFESPTY